MTDPVFPALHQPRVCRHLRGGGKPPSSCARCGGLLDVAYDWKPARPAEIAALEFEAKWADRANPLSFSGVSGGSRELLPFAPARAGPDYRRGADDLAEGRHRGRLRRPRAWQAVPAIRGPKPVRQLQG